MELMMFKRVAFAATVFILSGFRAGAQDKDSTWYYANNLSDYATADLVCLVRVGNTKILDTTGGYTMQEVSFEPLKFYKGSTGQRKFRAWLESHDVAWKPGTIHGYYLLKGTADPAYMPGQEGEMFYWLENAGFTAKDTFWLAKLSDTAYFKKMVTQYILPDMAGSWAKVSLIGIDSSEKENGPVTATIRLEADVPALQLQKGNEVPVTIWRDAYMEPKALNSRFQQQGAWEVILTREEGRLQMKTAFMLEQ
ncbi:MAG: hypothetical protein JNM21_12560 [Taibaiella sp.]|nr:hypothetical protein [Taibaiella sp.]